MRRREDVDVVVGVVETHGRAETQALLDGAGSRSRGAASPIAGSTLTEMDLDAILARRPQLALVDELAHTNAPGSRHPKRYMDVEELLAAGIDVYSTLNIQHVESLNDVVARITRIRVRETVPDSVLERADDIELIDLTPDDLIQRLKDGKVYVPAQAERAVRHYFAARQPDRAARTGAAPHRPARGQPDGRLHAQPRDRGAVARRRPRAGLRRRRRPGDRHRAPRQAAGGPVARALDRALRRDQPLPQGVERRTGQRGRGAAAGPTAGRRAGGPPRPGRRRDGDRLRPRPTTSRTSSSASPTSRRGGSGWAGPSRIG